MSDHLRWFFEIDGTVFGPVTEGDLRFQFLTGILRKETLVWRPGRDSWVPADQMDFFGKGAAGDAPSHSQGQDDPKGGDSRTDAGVKKDPPRVVYPSIGRRFSAYLLDILILTLLQLPVLFFIPAGVDESTREGIARLLGFLFSLGYFGALQGAMEGSPGKRLLRIRLVREDLLPLEPRAALKRAFLLPFGILCFGMGILAIFWRARKRAWHDGWAGSVVVTEDYFTAVRKRYLASSG